MQQETHQLAAPTVSKQKPANICLVPNKKQTDSGKAGETRSGQQIFHSFPCFKANAIASESSNSEHC